MKSNKTRILVEAQDDHHGDPSCVRVALDLALRCCENHPTQKVVILVPTKRNAQDTTLEAGLGERVTKGLLIKKDVSLGRGGATLSLETAKTFDEFTPCDVLIVVYVTPDALKLADESKAHSVIVVPWMVEDVTAWRRTWNPRVYQAGIEANGRLTATLLAAIAPVAMPANRVVDQGLKWLAATINVSTGLSHPMDKPKAVSLLKMLHKNGESFESEELRGWALRNGWRPVYAEQLAEVGQAVLNGKRISGGGEKVAGAVLLKKLRERALQPDDESQVTADGTTT